MYFLWVFNLPDNGFTVCEKPKTNQLTERIPVIFHSSTHEISDAPRNRFSGWCGFISEPRHRYQPFGKRSVWEFEMSTTGDRDTLTEPPCLLACMVSNAESYSASKPLDLMLLKPTAPSAQKQKYQDNYQ